MNINATTKQSIEINGVKVSAKNISTDGDLIIVDGKVFEGSASKEINIVINGDVEKVELGSGTVKAQTIQNVSVEAGEVNCTNATTVTVEAGEVNVENDIVGNATCNVGTIVCKNN